MVSTPMPVLKPLFQPKPCASMSAASQSSPTCDLGPAPWVLPNVCPPAISATVSSSFIAMRRNVSRISLAAAPGARGPLGPTRTHVDEAHRHAPEGIRELPVAAVALVAEPRALRSPVDLLRLPHILAPA